MQKVNTKFIQKWVDALRSRQFKQGTGKLHVAGPTPDSVSRFCCLGVACQLYGKIIPVNEGPYYTYKGESCSLPTEISDYIGLELDVQDELIELNDGERKKFYEIARVLERKYLSPHSAGKKGNK